MCVCVYRQPCVLKDVAKIDRFLDTIHISSLLFPPLENDNLEFLPYSGIGLRKLAGFEKLLRHRIEL